MSNNAHSEIDDDKRELRRGWTTGACATAAAKAAFIGLITGDIPHEIEITLPSGQKPIFAIEESALIDGGAMVAIEKDAEVQKLKEVSQSSI